MNIGPMEIAIVLILALLVFGPKRLPQAGRSLGQAIRELKKATSAARSDLGLDDVAADVRDLKSSLNIDLKAADQPASAQPGGGTVAPAAVIDVLPALSGAADTTEDTAASDDAGEAVADDAGEVGAADEADTSSEPNAPAAPFARSDA